MACDIIFYISLKKIEPNPIKIRKYTDSYKDAALAEDIKVRGVKIPLQVVSIGVDRYQLVKGHRRFKAAQNAGLDTIPAIILFGEGQLLELMVVENLLRSDLCILEQAELFHLLATQGYQQKRIAEIAGQPPSTINETMRLLAIPEDVRSECYARGHLKKKFLVSLCRFRDEGAIRDAFRYFLETGQLPPRKTRDYTDDVGKRRAVLTALRQAKEKMFDAGITYGDDGMLQQEINQEIEELLTQLLEKGWMMVLRN